MPLRLCASLRIILASDPHHWLTLTALCRILLLCVPRALCCRSLPYAPTVSSTPCTTHQHHYPLLQFMTSAASCLLTMTAVYEHRGPATASLLLPARLTDWQSDEQRPSMATQQPLDQY